MKDETESKRQYYLAHKEKMIAYAKGYNATHKAEIARYTNSERYKFIVEDQYRNANE